MSNCDRTYIKVPKHENDQKNAVILVISSDCIAMGNATCAILNESLYKKVFAENHPICIKQTRFFIITKFVVVFRLPLASDCFIFKTSQRHTWSYVLKASFTRTLDLLMSCFRLYLSENKGHIFYGQSKLYSHGCWIINDVSELVSWCNCNLV